MPGSVWSVSSSMPVGSKSASTVKGQCHPAWVGTFIVSIPVVALHPLELGWNCSASHLEPRCVRYVRPLQVLPSSEWVRL